MCGGRYLRGEGEAVEAEFWLFAGGEDEMEGEGCRSGSLTSGANSSIDCPCIDISDVLLLLSSFPAVFRFFNKEAVVLAELP